MGDHVFLKVSPSNEVTKFDKKGKLEPRFVGPFVVEDHILSRAILMTKENRPLREIISMHLHLKLLESCATIVDKKGTQK